jgi:signal peptidase I
MKLDRITTNPSRLNGQPCIRDLRLTVRRVLEILALYPVREELRQEYPEWEREDSPQQRKYEASSAQVSAEPVLVEYAKSFFPVLLFVFVLRSFLVEPFQIPSSSMVPTLQVGDYILVNKFTFGIRLPVVRTKVFPLSEPERGDVMVFFPPHLNDTYFIKRVIGLPGDSVRYANKHLFVNGEAVAQEMLAQLPPSRPRYQLSRETVGERVHEIQTDLMRRNDDFTVVVKPGHYFMMGDNRDNSSDRRVWGQVPEKDIVGKAFAIWMHWDSFFSIPSFQRLGSIQ